MGFRVAVLTHSSFQVHIHLHVRLAPCRHAFQIQRRELELLQALVVSLLADKQLEVRAPTLQASHFPPLHSLPLRMKRRFILLDPHPL